MGFKCGIVGLPNIGKSTLFNALTQTISAQAENYPFCTIEPNIGIVSVPDNRLIELAKIAGSKEIMPTKLTFVDIAGLVKGASRGEGLGNKFLANIREVDAILHVVRCFEDTDITHVDNTIDTIRDIETINTELILSDYESIEKRIDNIRKKARNGDKEAGEIQPIMELVFKALSDGQPARSIIKDIEAKDKTALKIYNSLQLITSKPVLYVCNTNEEDAVSGNEHTKKVFEYAKANGNEAVIISAKIECEIAELPTEEERQEFLSAIGLSQTGLSTVIQEGYKILNLITFFTVGPKETHAWTVEKGSLAPQGAGVIHSDFEKGFIRAETISYNDYIECKSEAAAREKGKLRIEGKTYQIQDGDIFHFLFNT